MRNRFVMLTAALALASATFAGAQTQAPAQPTPAPAPAPAPAGAAPYFGSIDFGARFTDTDGDAARFERYRDTRNGVYSAISLAKDTDTFMYDLDASQIGYRDQRYNFDYENRRLNFNFFFDSIPLNYLYDALTPWDRGNTTLTLNTAARQQVQGPTNATNDGTAVGVPCAPGAPPAACGNPTQAGQARANRSIYNNLANAFDMQAKRETWGFGGTVFATRDVGVNLSFASTKKSGEMPWGASFSFNNANEIPIPLDNRTNDFSTGVEFVKPKGMVRVAWDGSWFSNSNQVLIWDNPIRATDFNNGLAPPNGPYDPNGYSNGNGPSQGRMALSPDNSWQMFGATGLYKLARGTSINGTLQYRTMDQNGSLIPWTINPLIAQNSVYALFPGLATLPRSTAEAGASGLNALFNFTTRPWQRVSLQARYRYNERDMNTPVFDANEYVRFDAVPEDIEHGESEQFDVTRTNFDASATFSLFKYGSFRAGYGHEGYQREGRGFSDTGENTLRLSYDTMGLSFIGIRAALDYGQRRGDGFVLAGEDYESQLGGEQPGLRYYDEADRNRTKGSLMVSANPTDLMSIYLQFAAGKDEFLADESVPVGREQFGLLDQDFYSWNIGASLSPREDIAFGANYGYDKYSAQQKSRNANPPPDPSWTDPNRNWFLDHADAVNNLNLYLDLLNVGGAGIRFGYDYSDSDGAYEHSGPRVDQFNAGIGCVAGVTDCFIPLPNVTNTWQRFSADVKFFFTRQVGAGVGLYYEKLDVEDFATIDSNGSVGFTPATGSVRIDYLGEVMTGYMNRPYSGFSFFTRLLYRF